MNEIEVPPEAIQKFTCMGFSKEQVLCAYAEVSKTARHEDITSLWPAVLCHLREEQVYGLREGPQGHMNNTKGNATANSAHRLRTSHFSGSVQATSTLMACSSSDYSMQKSCLGVQLQIQKL